MRRLAHPDARPNDFRQPGHVFPLAGRDGGLVERFALRHGLSLVAIDEIAAHA